MVETFCRELERRGVSHAQWARRLDVSKAYISRVFAGVQRVSMDTLQEWLNRLENVKWTVTITSNNASLAEWSTLTVQQRAAITFAAEGLSAAEIGRRMMVSENTIKTHLRNAYRKLGARNRAHAVTLIMEVDDKDEL